jgi:hypothetical protein
MPGRNQHGSRSIRNFSHAVSEPSGRPAVQLLEAFGVGLLRITRAFGAFWSHLGFKLMSVTLW